MLKKCKLPLRQRGYYCIKGGKKLALAAGVEKIALHTL